MQRALSALSLRVWLAAAVFVLAGCQGEAESPAPIVEAPAAMVETLSVASAEMAGAIRASGLVSYKRETALAFGAPGEIEALSVDEGDRVAAGQTLATLRKTAGGADASESLLARQTAEQNFERISRLYANGAAAQVDLDNARLALERARERVAVTAPASGVVLKRDAERGQMVNAGQPILWIGEARTGLIVQAPVTSAEVARIKVGDTVTVNIRERAPLAGKVARIAAKSSELTGAFEIEVLVDQADGLRSGEVAEVVIAGRDGAAAPQFIVPAISLIDARADQGVVFVVDAENKARRRAVETGGVSDKGVVILKGLAQGDRVITRGASMVRDGDPVRVVGG
jgi:RND family efflux transporter MFP subunit